MTQLFCARRKLAEPLAGLWHSALPLANQPEHTRDMPFLVGCLALAFPRLALFFVWLLGGDYLTRPYEHWVWPLLGFLFFPLTTLSFAFATNTLGTPGEVGPFGWLLIGLSVLADAGLIGSSRRRKQDDG